MTIVGAALCVSAAQAATVTRIDEGDGPVIRYTTASGALDDVAVGTGMTPGAHRYGFFGGPRGGTLSAGEGCSEPLISCPMAPLDFRLLDGDDRLTMLGLVDSAFVDGGPGDDTVTGTAAADQILGGTGEDTLSGGDGGADRVTGGAGDDEIQLGTANAVTGDAGDDLLTGAGGGGDASGGSGIDTYSLGGTNAADITLDGVANDSYGGDATAMNIRDDIENVVTVGGDDRLVGNATANRLDSGEGDDQIVGGAGQDTLIGGTGADRIISRDGERDDVKCAGGGDVVTADVVDAVEGCEVVLLDRDADGADSDVDCNDTDPGRHPGLVDVPDNGIDEDCSGGDATARVACSGPPRADGRAVGASVNHGAKYTNHPRVRLTIVAPDAATSVQFANDGGFSGAVSTAPRSDETYDWRLQSTGRERLPTLVFVRFAGPCLDTSQTISDNIILDQTAPVVVRARLKARPAPAKGRTAATLTLKARDNASGVSRLQLRVRRRARARIFALRYRRRLALTGAKAKATAVRVVDGAGNDSRWHPLKGSRR